MILTRTYIDLQKHTLPPFSYIQLTKGELLFEFELPLNFKQEQLTEHFVAIKIIKGQWIGLYHP